MRPWRRYWLPRASTCGRATAARNPGRRFVLKIQSVTICSVRMAGKLRELGSEGRVRAYCIRDRYRQDVAMTSGPAIGPRILQVGLRENGEFFGFSPIQARSLVGLTRVMPVMNGPIGVECASIERFRRSTGFLFESGNRQACGGSQLCGLRHAPATSMLAASE